MNKKGQGMGMVAIAIMAIIGVVILGVVFSFLQDNSLSVQSVSQEEFTTTNESLVTLANSNIINSTVVVGNGTTVLTATVDYDISKSGRDNGVINISCFACVNVTSGYLNVSYSYYPYGYLENNTNRTLMGILPVLLAVALLIGMIGYNALKQ